MKIISIKEDYYRKKNCREKYIKMAQSVVNFARC